MKISQFSLRALFLPLLVVALGFGIKSAIDFKFSLVKKRFEELARRAEENCIGKSRETISREFLQVQPDVSSVPGLQSHNTSWMPNRYVWIDTWRSGGGSITIVYEWKNDDFVCSDVMFASQDWDSGR